MNLKKLSFNPCFNGYSTLTERYSVKFKANAKGFNPCFNGYSTLTLLQKQR